MSKQDRAAKAIKFAAARGYNPEQIATLLTNLTYLHQTCRSCDSSLTRRNTKRTW